MAEIYSRTSRVFVWLGYASELTSVAITCFNKIVSHVELDRPNYRMIALSADESWANEDVPLPFDGDECWAMSEFIGSKWFQRLWIVQEIWLAPDGAIMLYGHQEIKWRTLREAIAILLLKRVRLEGKFQRPPDKQ